MNYTDTFFKILIRLTDEFKVMKAQEELDKGGDLPDNAPTIPTVDSVFCIKDYKTIVSYQEMYPPEANFDNIGETGFACTLITLGIAGQEESMLCSWPLEKFEKKLNAHVEKLKNLA